MKIEHQRGMRGTLKSFDKAEHKQYDHAGKTSFMQFLNDKLGHLGLVTIENSNIHGIDLLTLNDKGEVIHCWEIEVRHGNWQGDVKFPFREINCIERKDYQWRREKSFLAKIPHPMAQKYRVSYVQLNRECTRAVVIEDYKILKYEPIPWTNRKAEGEYVRQVPISETSQFHLLNPKPIGYKVPE